MFDISKVSTTILIYKDRAKKELIRYLQDNQQEEIKGVIDIIARERGKLAPRFCRRLENIWLVEGRAYSAQVKSYASYSPDTPLRNDRIKYIGLGQGTQPEVPTISSLVSPIAYNAANHFLAVLNPPTFTTDKTVARYNRFYDVNEISVTGNQSFSEVGLFTDGAPPAFSPGTRDITLTNASSQAPLCYKAFEPIEKSSDLTITIDYYLYHN